MIAHMARVEIVCLREIVNDLIESLQKAGLLHVEETPLDMEDAPDFLKRQELEPEKQAALQKFEEMERTLNEITGMLSVSPTPQDIRNATAKLANMGVPAWDSRVTDSAEKLRSLAQRRKEAQQHIDVLRTYQRILNAVNPVLGSHEAVMGKTARAIVLQGAAKRAITHLENRFLAEVGHHCHVYSAKAGKSVVALVVYPEGKDERIVDILAQEGIAPVEVSDSDLKNASVKDVLGRISGVIAKRQEILDGVTAEIRAYSETTGPDLTAIKRLVADELKQLRVKARLARSEMVGVVIGWVPEADLPTLSNRIEKDYSGKAYVGHVAYDEKDVHTIPTLLHNHKFFKPFEVLLTLFRPPTYGTYDPTVLVAISFILFYGFILGDVVYGFAVIAFAQWLKKKWGHIPAVVSAGTVGTYMGISSIVFGVLYGEYAGDFGEDYLGLGYIWFHRGHEPSRLLLYGVIAGIIHIPLGLLLGIREDLRHHHKKHAQEKLGLLMGLCSVGIVACNNFDVPVVGSTPFMYVAAVLFVTGVFFIFKGMGSMGVVGVLEIISLVGNVLSYSRLMALGIASVVLADLANATGAQFGPLIGIPVAIAVHAVNIVIGMASPTIHSLRLNYVEFLPKFYSPEGRKYEPFRKEAL